MSPRKVHTMPSPFPLPYDPPNCDAVSCRAVAFFVLCWEQPEHDGLPVAEDSGHYCQSCVADVLTYLTEDQDVGCIEVYPNAV